MAVLTISREIGSEGLKIGKKAALELGYYFVDKHIMSEAFRQYGFIPFEKVYETTPHFWDQFDNMRTLTLENLNSVILALAHHGDVVIVGRGSFAVLAGLSDVLHVRVKAPFRLRLKRFMDETGLTQEIDARKRLDERDAVRSAFVESTYRVAWDAISNFDFVLDTGAIDSDTAVSWLVQAVKFLEQAPPKENAAASVEVDPYLATAVIGALKHIQ